MKMNRIGDGLFSVLVGGIGILTVHMAFNILIQIKMTDDPFIRIIGILMATNGMIFLYTAGRVAVKGLDS